MSEVAVVKIFDNEVDARMAQQVLRDAGLTAFVFKDEAGGPLINGVRLVVNLVNTEQAHQLLGTPISD